MQTTKVMDFVDFAIDAGKENSNLGEEFIKQLNSPNVTAQNLYQYLIDLGYKGVVLQDLDKVLAIYQGSQKAQGVVMETGY
jgi:hypothetical protein